jgi:hypothetical protein
MSFFQHAYLDLCIKQVGIRHGKVFFSYAFVTGDVSVPLQTVRTSNEPMSMIVLFSVRLF